jgi:peptidase YpeB-like protein
MRKYIIPVATAVALGIATPAMAYDSGGLMSMQDAIGAAADLGLVSVSHTNFLGDEWEIEGRDTGGRHMEVYIDAASGDVRGVNR